VFHVISRDRLLFRATFFENGTFEGKKRLLKEVAPTEFCPTFFTKDQGHERTRHRHFPSKLA
jgi:hypothetical protein